MARSSRTPRVVRSGWLGSVFAISCAAACGVEEDGQLEPTRDASSDVALGGGGSGGVVDSGPPDAFDDGQTWASGDADASDVAVTVDALLDDGALDADEDGDVDDATVKCGGVPVGGFCWYDGAIGQSCVAACQSHGGCNLAGTRDYAGSGGSDENCVAVLAALGYAKWPHQSYSNNDLGCQFAWGSWTYWSAALPTTCEATDNGTAAAHRMCACNE